MLKRSLIHDATIVSDGRSFKGSVLIEDEHIERIIEGEQQLSELTADTTIEAKGCFLLPGIIDEHVHFRDPGLTHKANIYSESRAAAAGGVTSWFDMPNTFPQTTTRKALDGKLKAAGEKSLVNYGFFFGVTADNASEIMHLDKRKVCGLKVFLGSSTGNMGLDDEGALRALFEHAALPIMAHCEDSKIIAANMAAYKSEYGNDPDVCFHPAIRSEEACYQSTVKAVNLARQYHARLHVAHISTARELSLFTPGDPLITAEACLPHLLFTDADYARLGTRIKCNPAIKTAADRAALRAALTDGRITTVATDHAPHVLSEKAGGAARAASGMPMVQFSLVAMLNLVCNGVLPIERLVELMCHAPARLFGVENRGFVREGYKADLVLVRPERPWTLTPNRIESLCNWSPVEGFRFNWQVEKTFCNGFLIYNHGNITDENYRGQPVTFNR